MADHNAYDTSHRSILDLLRTYGSVLEELHKRKIAKTRNSPVEGYAEWLVCRALSLTQMPNSNKGYDAVSEHDERYQIKARRVVKGGGTWRLSQIRNIEEIEFDYLVAVRFDADFSVREAIQVPHETVRQNSRHYGHTNAAVVVVNDGLRNGEGAEDITETIRSVVCDSG
ncbi:MAG: hypothetical protein IIC30_03925 [Chloroflexi bacterium]|nr:hypothetical protein [Chloroflexota bacterium]